MAEIHKKAFQFCLSAFFKRIVSLSLLLDLLRWFMFLQKWDAPIDPPLELDPLLKEAVNQLNDQLDQELTYRKGLKSKNRHIGLGLGIGSIVFSGLATIFGILGTVYQQENAWKILTPISAAVAATLQGALLGYPVDKRSVFHRILAAQTESLKDELAIRQYLEISPKYLEKVVQELQQIKLKGAAEEPESSDKVSSLTLEQIDSGLKQLNQIKAEVEALKQNTKANQEL